MQIQKGIVLIKRGINQKLFSWNYRSTRRRLHHLVIINFQEQTFSFQSSLRSSISSIISARIREEHTVEKFKIFREINSLVTSLEKAKF